MAARARRHGVSGTGSWARTAPRWIHLGRGVATHLLRDVPAKPIESDDRFRFPVPRQVLWRTLGRVDQYPRWWPWLRDFDGQQLAPGQVWTCTVQPPLPYALHFAIRLDEVTEARRVVATVEGDIVGHARIELHDRRVGCEVRLVASLAPADPVLRTAAALASPMVRYGHDWVLRTGARQFAARLRPDVSRRG
jgi:uncharacterized protein YndB with AHSA1/START domain